MVSFTDYGITLRRNPSAQAARGHALPASCKRAGKNRSASKLAVFSVLAVVFSACGSTFANAQDVSCTCRFKGHDYSLGESICLNGSDGSRMATCGMVLNNTSWQFSNAPCPLSRLQPDSKPAGLKPVPAVPGRAS